MSDVKFSNIQFCTAIGGDPLFVQGAGGNIWWTDSESLWVVAAHLFCF